MADPDGLRDTDYATELVAPASIRFPSGTEGRIERLRFKRPDDGREGYRFSWWKDGKMVPRPLDATGDEFLELMRAAVMGGVFTDRCLSELRSLLGS